MASSKRTARNIPYGYVKDPGTGEVVTDTGQQETIDRIIREYTLGIGFAGIARTLNDEEIPSARGKKWHGPAVKNVWDNVTHGRVDRVLKEDEEAAEVEASSPEAKATVALAEELRLQQDPDHQLETVGYYTMEDTEFDTRTGKLIDNSKSFNGGEWDQFTARIKAEEAAYKALTRQERADRHEFRDPERVGFGKSMAGVNEVVARATERIGEEMRYWIAAINGELSGKQRGTIKRKLTNATKELLAELAIQRQLTLHYHQERDWVLEVTKLTMEEVRMARMAREKGTTAATEPASVSADGKPPPEVGQ